MTQYKRTLLIRVDSNIEIASGHLMRCLSIAAEAKSNGMRCVFLMSDNKNQEYVECQGFEYINLDTDWRDLTQELPKIDSLIKQYINPILLIDTYSITSSYTSHLYGKIPLVYLGSKTDDIGPLNAIINYSSKINTSFYNTHYPDALLLLGVEYAPLKKEFQNISPEYKLSVTDILITTGNTDKLHFVSNLLQNIKERITKRDLKFHVVVGRLFDNLEELRNIADGDTNIILHFNVSNMRELMQCCQICVSANGTTIYELAACGIPTVSFALAKEQIESGESLGTKGIVNYCGYIGEDWEECMKQIIDSTDYLLLNTESRIDLGKKAKTFIDGNGCKYIIQNLKKLKIK